MHGRYHVIITSIYWNLYIHMCVTLPTLLNYINKCIVELKCCHWDYLYILDLVTVLKVDYAVIVAQIAAIQLLFQI